MLIRNILLVAIGGAAGSVLRYVFGRYFQSTSFPLATFIVNILGCLLIGLLIGNMMRQQNEQWRLLLVTGFCGGFTTFSAFSLETLQLIQEQKWMLAATYIIASVILGVTATFVGIYLTK